MSIFPFISTVEETYDSSQDLEEFKEMAYDYENNCFLLQGGKPYYVVKNEAIKIWIYKALKTKRFVYPAYSHSYGTEIDRVIEEHISNKEIVESEIKRYIIEALMVNPYIQELSNFKFAYLSKVINVNFVVDTIYDKITYESEVYNNG